MEKKDVAHIARLARLSASDDDLDRYASQLTSIFEYIGKVLAAPTDDVTPMSHVHGIHNVFRDDAVAQPMPADEGLRNAPAVSGTFFKTPLVIE